MPPTVIPKLSPADLKPIALQTVKDNLLSAQQNLPLFLKNASQYQVQISIADDLLSLRGSESIQYTIMNRVI